MILDNQNRREIQRREGLKFKRSCSTLAVIGTPDLEDHDITIEDTTYNFIVNGEPQRMVFGGGHGTDTTALKKSHLIRSEVDFDFNLEVIIPFKVEDQPEEARASYDLADRITELDLQDHGKLYLRRNDRIVDESDVIIAYWDGESERTEYTIEKGEEKGIAVYVIDCGGDVTPDPK